MVCPECGCNYRPAEKKLQRKRARSRCWRLTEKAFRKKLTPRERAQLIRAAKHSHDGQWMCLNCIGRLGK